MFISKKHIRIKLKNAESNGSTLIIDNSIKIHSVFYIINTDHLI